MAEIRPPTRESCRQSGRETESAFAAFLSDDSDDEEADDAHTRALLRMQEQADDSAYSDAPFKADPAAAASKVSMTDVLDLVALVERASRVVGGQLDVKEEKEPRDSDPQSPKRKTSARGTESAFADFVSDSSDEEDEDDADTRALLRMQQQADDRTYVDTLKMADESGNRFRLTWAKPGAFDAREDEALLGPRRLVEEATKTETTGTEDRPSDVDSFVDADADVVTRNASGPHDSLASRPPSFGDAGDSFFDEPRPSFSDEHSFTTGGDSFADNSFVYRPSLPDDDESPSEALKRVDSSFVDASFVYRPSVAGDDRTPKDRHAGRSDAEKAHVTVVHRPPLFSSDQTGSIDVATVAHSVESRPSLADNDHATLADGTADDVVYRPTLPDEEDGPEIVFGYTHAVKASTSTTEERSLEYRPSPTEANVFEGEEDDEPSFLSPSASSFIRPSDAVAFDCGGLADSSFRLHQVEADSAATEDDSFCSVLTDSCASNAPPELGTSEQPNGGSGAVQTFAGEQDESEASERAVDSATSASPAEVFPSTEASIEPPLSRKSSAASSTTSSHECFPQRRLTASRESWRVSALDLSESKHAFDEELGPLASDSQSPRASAGYSERQRQRLSSTVEERASASSNLSNSFASFHSQANFFVDDIQQSFSSVSSLSLDSRPSGDDSFFNVATLGDDVRDQDERRSSDIISQEEIGAETLDRSYSDLVQVDVAAGLDRSFSQLVDRDGFYPVGRDCNSANDTILGSSLASSAVSQSSATSDELPFVSFNGVKSPPSAGSTSIQLQKQVGKRSPRRQPTNRSQQALYRSFMLPRGRDVKPSRSPATTGTQSFSSAALLAAIKTRDARTNTRSEETEAGDVACGALLPLEPPLKLKLAPRGRGSLSSSLLAKSGAAASPVAPSSLTRSSVASSTDTADRLDFTGVYRGSANSLEASHSNDTSSYRPGQSREESKLEKRNDALKFDLFGVKLERSTSDSRTMQRASQRKVEEFFRKTHHKSVDDIDEREPHRWTNRKTRARTTVIQCVDDAEKMSRHFDGKPEAKIIDLKNLRHGGKRSGWHLEDDARPVPQREDSSKQAAMGMTTGTTSTGTTATRSMPSDHVSGPLHYVISPQAADAQKPKILAKKKTNTAGGGDGLGRHGAAVGRRAGNLSLTPSLPRLSANESPALSSSPFVTSFTPSSGFGASDGMGIGRSPGKSPVAFAGTATGFLWKAGSGFNGFKRSADAPFDASQVSYAQRSTLAGRVQSLSASLASTLRRFLPGRYAQQQSTTAGLTSPQSQCTAPAALPRGYDHNGFYELPFKVPGLNKPVGQRKEKTVESDRAWVRQWLILATCALLGLSLGAILVSVVSPSATVFNLSANEVREGQASNGEMVVSTGGRWLLLPGRLFLRVWTAVTTVLLLCYVSTGLADLVGCADKAALVLSFRSLGYALGLAGLAALEGVVAMWMTHSFGWFRGDSGTTSTEGSTLSDAIGATSLPKGIVGLLCAGDSEYLQRLGHDVFACSNASLTLPLYDEIAVDSPDNGPAVFRLQEVTTMLATPTSVSYYPASLGSRGNVTLSLLSALAPSNVASQFTPVELDELASLSGLVVFGLLLGYVCGKRMLSLRRDAQAVMFESVGSASTPDPHKARHYIIGILMELQLVLEWIVRPMERYLAPLGFFSLMLGHVVAHHREWRSLASPVSSLVVGVLSLLLLHAALVLPIVLRLLSSTHQRLPWLKTIRAFAPALLFAFTTDSVALTAPVSMQCYARANTTTRSAAQLATAVTAALSRNARALYLPLLVLWLLETSTSDEVRVSSTSYFAVWLLSLLSSFSGGSSRVTLAMAHTLWAVAVRDDASSAASVLPPTMPLVMVCDVMLSRVANVLTVMDQVVLAQFIAQHWDETVVGGHTATRNDDSNVYVASPSPLDDSQAPRPSSSAMLSSVYL
ncbi:Sodium:dicarboxylate symporter family [Phytophthora infestans]|uniref:Sodium:dicarboxylate symporter family n=1 Tax=Phytophthora infestans TaxID=4787 RepID=A0A8S9V669_PHYIN|nr:Sodium:dicarboxylate symporter family [Phytophthora infestans]